MLFRIGGHFTACDTDQWADKWKGHRSDSDQAARTRPAKQVEQHRFRQVVHRVSQGDSCRAAACRGIEKELQPHIARRLFDPGLVCSCCRFDVDRFTHERQFALSGAFSHETCVRLRFCSPQLMIEVGDGEIQTQFGGDVAQQIQQHDRVDSAGHGDEHPIPLLKH